jgi:hypothetical protein
MRGKSLSQSQFDDLKASVKEAVAEATGSHTVHSVPPTVDQVIGRTVRHFLTWLFYTKAGTAAGAAIAAAIGGVVTALLHKLTHFLGP